MIYSCWSLKGGSGTTTIATAMAMAFSRESGSNPTLLVDLAGDIPFALGIVSTAPVGIGDWLAAHQKRENGELESDALKHLEYEVIEGTNLLTRGQKPLADILEILESGAGVREIGFQVSLKAEEFMNHLATETRDVIIDCGNLWDSGLNITDQQKSQQPDLLFRRAVAQTAQVSYAFTKSCYLSLRRLAGFHIKPKGVVLLKEPGRSLTALDVSEIVGAPIFLNIAYDTSVMRAVDGGLLSNRLPRKLERLLGLQAPQLPDSPDLPGDPPGSGDLTNLSNSDAT